MSNYGVRERDKGAELKISVYTSRLRAIKWTIKDVIVNLSKVWINRWYCWITANYKKKKVVNDCIGNALFQKLLRIIE